MDGLIKSAIVAAGLTLAGVACGDAGDDALTATPASSTVLGASEAPEDSTVGTVSAGTCTPRTYEVQSGDVLSSIALEFDATVIEIAEASDLEDPDVLEVGQELTIPCESETADEADAEADAEVDTDVTEGSPTPAP